MTTGAVSKRGKRDRRGRWLPGCKGGPGNPRLRVLAEHRQAIASAVTTDQLVAVVQALVEQALKGNVAAAQAVLERVVGRPRSPLPQALRASSPAEAARAALAAAARGEADSAEALAFARGCLDVGEHEQLVNLEERLRELEARP